jgi:hypothetical protein
MYCPFGDPGGSRPVKDTTIAAEGEARMIKMDQSRVISVPESPILT